MYKTIRGKVSPKDKSPEPYVEEASEIKTVSPVQTPEGRKWPWQKCEHGFHMRSNCLQCTKAEAANDKAEEAPPPVKITDNRAATKLLTGPEKPESNLEKLARAISTNGNPDVTLYDELHTYAALTVGMKVCRKIRPNQYGRITYLERYFQDSIAIRNVWVMWDGKGVATPYTIEELLKVKEH